MIVRREDDPTLHRAMLKIADWDNIGRVEAYRALLKPRTPSWPSKIRKKYTSYYMRLRSSIRLH